MLPVARTIACDVVLARRRPIATYRRPLIATALDPDMFRRLAITARAALVPNADRVVVVHAYRPLRTPRVLFGAHRIEAEIEQATRESLRSLVAATTASEKYELVTCCGDTATAVLDVANREGCDLVVVGACRPRFWRRRSLVDRLLASARCDISIVLDRR